MPMYYLTTLLWVDIFIVSHFTIIKQGLHKHVCAYAYIVLQAELLKVALLLVKRLHNFHSASVKLSPKKVFPMSVPMKSIQCTFFAHPGKHQILLTLNTYDNTGLGFPTF